jgi:hypothetical protein
VGSPDIAENITTSESVVEAGDVVAADPMGHEKALRSRRAYDTSGTALDSFQGKPGKTGKVIVFLALQPAPSADPKLVERLEARVSDLERRLATAASLERRLAALEVQLASRTSIARQVASQPQRSPSLRPHRDAADNYWKRLPPS